MAERKLTAKQSAKKLDDQISRAFKEHCANVQVDIMDMGKIFDAGRLAALNGYSVERAVVEFVETIRKN